MFMKALTSIHDDIIACRLCPRLVHHREAIAKNKAKRFSDWNYWGKAVPSFGDPKARLLIVGLAPAAHGANRTGRMFTGDRSGDWLYEALYRFGFSNQRDASHRSDGLHLVDSYITAVAHCAPPMNKLMRQEIVNCRCYLIREMEAIQHLRVVILLGRIAHDGFLAACKESGRRIPRPKPQFAHFAEAKLLDGVHLIDSYHPSQQNTFTGKLTRPMFHRVFRRARKIIDAST